MPASDPIRARIEAFNQARGGGVAVHKAGRGYSLTSGHRQLVGRRSRWRAMRTACWWLRRSGDAGDLGPNPEGLGPGGSILGGGYLVAEEAEEIVNPIMGGEETLRLAG